jgi:hypothetical protein
MRSAYYSLDETFISKTKIINLLFTLPINRYFIIRNYLLGKLPGLASNMVPTFLTGSGFNKSLGHGKILNLPLFSSVFALTDNYETSPGLGPDPPGRIPDLTNI